MDTLRIVREDIRMRWRCLALLLGFVAWVPKPAVCQTEFMQTKGKGILAALGVVGTSVGQGSGPTALLGFAPSSRVNFGFRVLRANSRPGYAIYATSAELLVIKERGTRGISLGVFGAMEVSTVRTAPYYVPTSATIVGLGVMKNLAPGAGVLVQPILNFSYDIGTSDRRVRSAGDFSLPVIFAFEKKHSVLLAAGVGAADGHAIYYAHVGLLWRKVKERWSADDESH